MTDLPDYYFRIRENGAVVFRVENSSRQQRIEMEQIAVININRGDYKPLGDRSLTETDIAQIEKWLETRNTILRRRMIDDIHRTIDHLNLTAQWAQTKASDAELADVTDTLLLAMHDLRSVLVRKKAERVTSDADD